MSEATPMYRQWLEAKQAYPDALMLFKMGDFYELFSDDAETGAESLGLTLTSRRYLRDSDERVVMCGFPEHTLDRYVRKLVEQGHRVAICEQVENAPLKRTTKQATLPL